MRPDRIRDEHAVGLLDQTTVPRLSSEQREELLSELVESSDTESTPGSQNTDNIETPEFAQLAFVDADDE